MFAFLKDNSFIEHKILKGFVPNVSGMFEHTTQVANVINNARVQQRSVIITLFDLKECFWGNLPPGTLEHGGKGEQHPLPSKSGSKGAKGPFLCCLLIY